MNAIIEIVNQGGVVMIALIILSVILYERCFDLVLKLRQMKKYIGIEQGGISLDMSHLRLQEMQFEDAFSQRMINIKSLIAAAPLLGLLGTVMGMVNTFSSLADRGGGRSIEGLADGISMALVTTETGLAIAIPAGIIVYLAQRQMDEGISNLVEIEAKTMEGSVAP